MDPEQTFIRVQERFSRMLTPKLRAGLEYMFLFIAITLFCVLVVMHANYVQQPGCSSELSGVEAAEAQLIRIKITSAGLWSQNASDAMDTNVSDSNILTNSLEVSSVDEDGLTFLAAKFWLNWIGAGARRAIKNDKEEPRSSFPVSAKETFKAAVIHFGRRWYRRLLFIWRYAKQIIRSFWKLWNFAGVNLNVDVPKWLHIFHLDRLFFATVRWLERKSKTFEPTYLYTMEKGYFLLPEGAKARHNIHTVNISISARHSCFGNRWQQLLINRFVGYDTILMNSLLTSPGQGYLYNYQTKEFYNLSHAHEPPEGPARFGDYLVTKCGVLMMSLFVFFTTTMSVSFTLRETQTRMLKFTVQLQHHARHHLPTFQLIFVHVIESLVFVPIMIGILFFLFEFYDDQLLAFMVLILVWLSELFTLISVRTPISMKFFPRFFLLYFLVFHIYFFSYAYGFSYLALSTAAAFMQHLILYFWNRFEFHFTRIILIILGFISKICYGIICLRKQQWTKVEKIVAIIAWLIWIVQLQVPALQRFMQNRRSQLQQHPDFHITSSTFLASTLHITRLNTRDIGPMNVDMSSVPGSRPGHEGAMRRDRDASETGEQLENDDSGGVQRASLSQDDSGPNPGNMSSFSSLLLWILGGASSEGLNSFLSMFRDAREQGQVYRESPAEANNEDQNSELGVE